KGGAAYGGRKIVSKRETARRVPDRLQGVRRSGGQGLAVRDHRRRGAPAVGPVVRNLRARLDARMDGRGRHRFRHTASPRARGGAAAGGGGASARRVAARPPLDCRRRNGPRRERLARVRLGHGVRPRFSGAAHRFSGAAPGLREVARPEGPPYVPWQAFRRDVWPIGAGIVLSALYFRVDVFLVQLWSGTESVALYNAVFRLVDALRRFPAAVVAVALPSLCRASDLRPLARVALP